MAARTFTVELQRTGKTGTFLEIPFDVREVFGRARPPVRVTIRGHTYRSTVAVYDDREVAVPADLAKALAEDPAARESFDRFSFSQYLDWIEEAKRPETRSRRIGKAVVLLPEGRTHR